MKKLSSRRISASRRRMCCKQATSYGRQRQEQNTCMLSFWWKMQWWTCKSLLRFPDHWCMAWCVSACGLCFRGGDKKSPKVQSFKCKPDKAECIMDTPGKLEQEWRGAQTHWKWQGLQKSNLFYRWRNHTEPKKLFNKLSVLLDVCKCNSKLKQYIYIYIII